MNEPLKIPVNHKRREIQSYSGPWEEETMFNNFTFLGLIQFSTMARGRSSATFGGTVLYAQPHNMVPIPFNPTAYTVSIFMAQMLDMLATGKIVEGRVWGVWDFIKRGQNYSIRMREPARCPNHPAIQGLEIFERAWGGYQLVPDHDAIFVNLPRKEDRFGPYAQTDQALYSRLTDKDILALQMLGWNAGEDVQSEADLFSYNKVSWNRYI